MKNNTINYYNNNAKKFVDTTGSVNFQPIQDKFLQALHGLRILDFGCGSGRDTRYFLEKGYKVTAIDGSEALCIYATQYTGILVRQMLFQELSDTDCYDGIWACASILHLPKAELKEIFEKMLTALHSDGIIYTSFKYGDFEGERNGRHFTDFTIDSFKMFIKNIEHVQIKECWITNDARPEREDEKWLNLLLQKTSF